MANTLSSLVPDLYEALDVVSRELVGFIPAVSLDTGVARAAVGQNVRSFVTPASTAEDVTPGQLPPDDGDQSIGNVPITISKVRAVPFRWTGEEQKGVQTGPGYAAIRQDQIRQAFRTLSNEIDAFLGAMYVSASRAYGTPNVAPFATDLSDPAQVRKILSDNGAPLSDMQLVIDTTAGAKVRSLAQLTKANEAGTTELRAQGKLLDIHGFSLRESAGVRRRTALGTGAGYLLNGAVVVGQTVLPIDTGTGTILAGDFITIAGDTNKYMVAGALAGGNVTIAAPGIMQATADNTAITVNPTAFSANLAFARSAIVLATRLPALPEEGDSADDAITLVDERSGLAFEVRMYKQYRRVRYEVALAYGGALVKPEHTAIMLG